MLNFMRIEFVKLASLVYELRLLEITQRLALFRKYMVHMSVTHNSISFLGLDVRVLK